MRLYRFSPIRDQKALMRAVRHVHFACHELCKQSFGEYLPVTGTIGVFCHYDDEYKHLTNLRQSLTDPSDNWNQKYFRLYQPITISAKGDVPEATYTYLYIRHPDPYRFQVGDVDFYLPPGQYDQAKELLKTGQTLKGARIYPGDMDMIELYNPDVDCCAYILNKTMTQRNKEQESV